ncbi:MAG TPA: glycoside hydrolase family 71/99-like protein [Polyangiaceae bacterium]|nr:glycoside hydrolase family 71/99-like protein [Polyangiaceae bacterium]
MRPWSWVAPLCLGVFACSSGESSPPSGGTVAGSSGKAAGAGAGGASNAGQGGVGGSAGSQSPTGGAGSGGSGGSGGSAGSGPPPVVDPSTLSGKQVFGYQGWFACPADGSQPDRWVHWFNGTPADPDHASFDLWPDVSELDADELFPTAMTLPGGAPASVYSAFTEKTVVRHFQWMKDAGIDGVVLQRFLNELGDPAFKALRDQVLRNVMAGAEQHGRVFAVMYDISGADAGTLNANLVADWKYLVDTLQVTASDRYLQHEGKPLLAIWGLGFNDRPATAAQAQALIDELKSGVEAQYQVTLLGGVPTHWRTLMPDTDTQTDPAWADVFRSYDVVSPWAVGRFIDDGGSDTFRSEHFEPDLAELAPLGIDYLPVVWPGFSWVNLNDGPLNQIPRHGGAFYWRQVYNALDSGATMLYGAMFDEVDEGTAFFKAAPSSATVPEQGTWLTLDADGQTLPSDWYLRVAGAATEVVRGERELTETVPISP